MNCTRCSLHSNCVKQAPGRGSVKSPIMVIGSSPTNTDSRLGVPFTGVLKEKLDEALKSIGFQRQNIWTSNLVQCPVKEGEELRQENVDMCYHNLDQEVSYIKPKVIIIMGDSAVNFLLGRKKVDAVAGRVWDSSETRTFTFSNDSSFDSLKFDDLATSSSFCNTKGAFKVIPTYSIEESLGSPSKITDIKQAFELARKVLSGEYSEVSNHNYIYGYTEADIFKVLSEVADKARTEKRMTFDWETSGLNYYKRMHHSWEPKVISASFVFKEKEGYAVSLRQKYRSERVMKLMRDILASQVNKCAHNGSFDNQFAIFDLKQETLNYTFDTIIAAFLLNQGGELGLEKLAGPLRPDLGRWWEEVEPYLDKNLKGYENCPDSLLLPYNLKDSDATMTLWNVLEPRLERRGKLDLMFNYSMPHQESLSYTETVGILLDVEGSKKLGISTLEKNKLIEEEACASVGMHPHHWTEEDLRKRDLSYNDFKPLNIGSDDQLADILFSVLKLPVQGKTPNGLPSTDKDTLKALKEMHPFVNKVSEYKGYKKSLSSYIGWGEKKIKKKKKDTRTMLLDLFQGEQEGAFGVVMDEGDSLLSLVDCNGVLHPSYKIYGAATGRISAVRPAIQTIPKKPEFRSLFIPRPGYCFIDADFKAIELRLLAMFSNDPDWIRIFKLGLDPHSITASKMLDLPIIDFTGKSKAENDAYFKIWNKKYADQRKKAKTVNFGIPYGEGPEGLSHDLGTTKQEAQSWLDLWDKTYPAAAAWLKARVEEALTTGRVKYSANRERPLFGAFSSDKSKQGEAGRQSKNTPIQGTAGDCCTTANIRIYKAFKSTYGLDNARIVAEVHDQILSEVKIEIAEEAMNNIVIAEMTRRMPFLPDTLDLEVDAEIKYSFADAVDN
jgi:DNA polymerase-1